jgi:pimeloyl-ACP methyl ester carboxylesterase
MVLLAAAALAVPAAFCPCVARAQPAFTSCANTNTLACARLEVPLSPTDAAAGVVKLAIRRRRAPVGESRSAVIALAGGPGQAAIPFVESFAETLGPIISTRDLIVFDQRGTGLSGALKCRAFRAEGGEPPAKVVKRCAQQLGPRRGFYTTQESVADIEAIRVAGGYEKLVLYGTSYGTKVALRYAQLHPGHVEALVLDSVVPPEGPESLGLSTFAAVSRVLWSLCAFHSCSQVTSNPVSDVRKLVSRMNRKRVAAPLFDGHGHRHTLHIGSATLLDILVAGDLDPILRAEFPSAVRSADDGDPAPLARLMVHAVGSEAEESEQGSDPAFDVPLYFATMCEEEQFPWSRSSSPSKRLAEAQSKIASLPASAFGPFARSDVLAFSDIPQCVEWPFTRLAPPSAEGSLPAVPTLIISGAEDLRTPTSNARAVAARIPGSHVLVVPNTGHSVLTTEPESCALDALDALFSKHAIKACKPKPPPIYLKPTPLAPRRLAQVRSPRGYSGRVGRTLGATALTLGNLVRELAITIGQQGGLEAISHAATGGLRGGWSGVSGRRLRLHRYSYVPGLSLSGSIGSEQIELHVEGRSAADGTLRLEHEREFVGTLGGMRIRISDKRLKGSAPSSLAGIARARGQSLGHALARDLRTRQGGRVLSMLCAVAAMIPGAEEQGPQAALLYELEHPADREVALR